MAPDDTAAVPPDGTGTLRRSLGLRDLIVYGLLFIGPTAPMGTFGVLDARSHGATALVFVIATVAMAFTAWSYARMAAAVPRAGSVFAYAQAGLGRLPGFIAGWMLGLDYLFIPALASLFTGIAAHSLVPAVPVWVFITALNLIGVKVAAAVGMIMLAVEILLLVIFVVGAVVVLIHDGPSRPALSPLTGVGGFDLSGVLGAVSIAVLAFLGFDAIASFAEENTGSPSQVGRALLFCLTLAGLLFVVQTYLAGLLMRPTPEQLAADPAQQGTAFYQMLRDAIGGWFGQTVTAVRAIGPIFSALVAQAAVSRLMYGMARDRRLPTMLGRLGARRRTPYNAIALSAVVTVVIAVLAALRDDGLDLLSSMVTVGALVAFVFLHASVVGYYLVGRRTDRPVRHLVLPLIGVVIVLVALVLASRPALIIGGGWMLIGLLVAVVQRRRSAM